MSSGHRPLPHRWRSVFAASTAWAVAGCGSDADDAPDDAELRAQVCERWTSDRADRSEGSFNGDIATCDAGTPDVIGGANALRLVNLYRWLAGLPVVTLSDARSREAQECALMMQANGTLSHTPPSTWECYTATGASAAGLSNIATAPSVAAIDMYMQDWGNETTLGHRRWILSTWIDEIGVGSAPTYSCLHVLAAANGDGPEWTAWPPPGVVPHELFTMSYQPLDSTGWSIHSDTIAFDGAAVTVTDAGTSLPIETRVLDGGYGSVHALSFLADGWTAQPGHTYHVEVSGLSSPIAYDVEVIECGGPT